MKDLRFVFTAAHFAAGKKLLKILCQIQPFQRRPDLPLIAGRGNRHGNALCRKSRQKLSDARLGLRLVAVKCIHHIQHALMDLLLRLHEIICLFQIGCAVRQAEGKEDLVESLLRLLAQTLQVARARLIPDFHGVQQRPVHVEDGSADVSFFFFIDHILLLLPPISAKFPQALPRLSPSGRAVLWTLP